ncbi:apolipoprotein N-acyltransferase [Psychroflexus aestuariivivens]|uniref:apolipoprotein N-acyltransferase n=1 Tax=Psychroflexus aestuariivivens TaxID=1795040 RepID=UPI000FD95D85|nr:apolipoprotein N-acyltransferase [Psychroflexus aestuariivivens]
MKNIVLAIISGLLLAFSWPTYGLSFLSFIGFVPLLFAEFNLRNTKTSHTKWKVFGLAYLSFLIWNIISTYWLYFSTPFGGVFAIVANSLLMSLVFLLFHIVAKRVNFTASASFLIALWLVFEKMHLNWEFSWPWLNLGNVFSENTTWIQWYEITGTFGGSLWVLFSNVVIFKSLLLFKQHKDRSILVRLGLKMIGVIGIPILISVFIHPETGSKTNIDTIVLQPNIDPYKEKYHTDDSGISELLTELSSPFIKKNKNQLLLAPETVFAEGTAMNQYLYSQANSFSKNMLLKNPQLNLLYGISMGEIIRDKTLISPQSNFVRKGIWINDFNSAVFKNKEQKTKFYHKSKLVVGVENFPYQSILKPILGNIMIDLGGTVAMKTTQVERTAFKMNNNNSVAPIICYESVYGEYVTEYVRNGANILAIITNDAWWGETQGHQQHWSYAKLRAIETRRAVARSANTGISGFIDKDGSVLKSSEYNEKIALNAELPLYSGVTFYVKYGDYISRIAQFLALFILLFAITRRKSEI